MTYGHWSRLKLSPAGSALFGAPTKGEIQKEGSLLNAQCPLELANETMLIVPHGTRTALLIAQFADSEIAKRCIPEAGVPVTFTFSAVGGTPSVKMDGIEGTNGEVALVSGATVRLGEAAAFRVSLDFLSIAPHWEPRLDAQTLYYSRLHGHETRARGDAERLEFEETNTYPSEANAQAVCRAWSKYRAALVAKHDDAARRLTVTQEANRCARKFVFDGADQGSLVKTWIEINNAVDHA